MRRLVFGLGGLQVVVTALAIGLGALWLGQPPAAALIIGTCLALSSTAIVMELLSGQRRMMSTTGRTSFAILLAQDLAVVPLLFLISALGGSAEGASMVQGVVVALAEAVIAVGVIAVVGRARAEAAVPAGRRHRQSGILHGRHPADLGRLGRDRGLCRPVDGARRLHRRAAAGGDRVPPRRRGDDRPVPRPAAGRLLLLGRHAYRSRLHLARTAAGGRRLSRHDRGQDACCSPRSAGCSACRGRPASRPACCWRRAANSPSSASASPSRSGWSPATWRRACWPWCR